PPVSNRSLWRWMEVTYWTRDVSGGAGHTGALGAKTYGFLGVAEQATSRSAMVNRIVVLIAGCSQRCAGRGGTSCRGRTVRGPGRCPAPCTAPAEGRTPG